MSKRVLIAEDDRQMAEILREVIGCGGFETRVSFDGADTLAVVRAWRPHLIVLDIMLPVIDGFHVCQAMNDDPALEPKPKVFIISGRSSDMDKNLGTACGAEEYFVKPLNNAKLLSRIQSVLSIKKGG